MADVLDHTPKVVIITSVHRQAQLVMGDLAWRKHLHFRFGLSYYGFSHCYTQPLSGNAPPSRHPVS